LVSNPVSDVIPEREKWESEQISSGLDVDSKTAANTSFSALKLANQLPHPNTKSFRSEQVVDFACMFWARGSKKQAWQKLLRLPGLVPKCA
jgi:hypothetical protein